MKNAGSIVPRIAAALAALLLAAILVAGATLASRTFGADADALLNRAADNVASQAGSVLASAGLMPQDNEILFLGRGESYRIVEGAIIEYCGPYLVGTGCVTRDVRDFVDGPLPEVEYPFLLSDGPELYASQDGVLVLLVLGLVAALATVIQKTVSAVLAAISAASMLWGLRRRSNRRSIARAARDWSRLTPNWTIGLIVAAILTTGLVAGAIQASRTFGVDAGERFEQSVDAAELSARDIYLRTGTTPYHISVPLPPGHTYSRVGYNRSDTTIRYCGPVAFGSTCVTRDLSIPPQPKEKWFPLYGQFDSGQTLLAFGLLAVVCLVFTGLFRLLRAFWLAD